MKTDSDGAGIGQGHEYNAGGSYCGTASGSGGGLRANLGGISSWTTPENREGMQASMPHGDMDVYIEFLETESLECVHETDGRFSRVPL